MKIALDYDGTITADPFMWGRLVWMAKNRGHDIRIVTFRFPEECTQDLQTFAVTHGLTIVFTSRKLKKQFCEDANWHPDVWIDDVPSLIGDLQEPWSDEKLQEWKQSIKESLVDSDISEIPS